MSLRAKKQGEGEEKFDTRVIDQRLRRGEVTPEEHSAYLKKLDDDEKRAEYVSFYEEPSEGNSAVEKGLPTFVSA